MRSTLAKNQLGKFLSDSVLAAGLQSGKIKLSHHLVGKTGIGRLLDANIPESYVMQLSGHKNIQSLSAYKSVSTPDVICTQQTKPASNAELYPHKFHDSIKVPFALNIHNAVTSVSSSYPSTSNALEAIFAGTKISSVSDCTFQIMTVPVNIVNEAALKRPRRHIIESDDED